MTARSAATAAMPLRFCLIADDLDNRTRYLNIRNTILTLMKLGAVPIINENDTVSVDELQTTFGDNDRLAAMVTNLIRAPLLVLLSDVDGLYNGDPNDPASQVIPTVTQLDDSIWSLVRDRTTGLSKGGMASKLEAARVATSAGENVIIASGKQPGNLMRILAGEQVGTLFVAARAVDSVMEALDRTNRSAARQADSRRRRAPRRRNKGRKPFGDRYCRRRGGVSQRGRRRSLRSKRGGIRPRADKLRRRRSAAD